MALALAVLSIAVTPVIEVGKYLVGKIKTEFDYVTKHDSYLLKFQDELHKLQEMRNDVDEDVKEAIRELKKPREKVSGWVRRVKDLEDECKSLTTNNNTDNKCLMVLRCSRRRISKKILKLTKDICDLKEEEESFTCIAHQQPSSDVVYIEQTGIVENFLSRKRIMKEVVEALEDPKIKSIGVFGMGGIGKTTLVTSINNELLKTHSSKKVLMVTVSKDTNNRKIQDKIAERLGLKLEEQDMSIRADKLRQRLKSEESVLIILDDVWDVMQLGKIGLQHSTEPMPCKFIVTTRNADVCRKMGVEKEIEMGILHEDEAWTLFKAKASDVVEKPSLKETAGEIVSRCKGSPLAICILGSTLRAEMDERIWAHYLQVLKEPNAMGLDDIMPEVVTSLRLSYDHLEKKPNVQLCFLYCCLFPEDYNIRLTDLRNYGIGEGFLKMTSSLAEARNELLRYVKILKDCCLLLVGDDKSSVKMHDVVRDVAICIASNENDGFLVNVGGGSKYLPESDKLHTYKRISYMYNHDSVFPDALQCSHLRSLLVRDSKLEKNYSFEGVKSLLVLHMSWRWGRVSVSESISQLRNLRTLYLDRCNLSDKTYLLGGLTKLEVLSMRRSEIGELPVDFGNLINLKFLDLTRAGIDFVAPNVFSSLLKLEELLIVDSITGWDTTGKLKDDDDGSRRYAELKEVLSLPCLSVLDIAINRPLLDGEVLNYHNLQNFRIYVGYLADMVEDFSYDTNELSIGSTDLGKHWIRNLIVVSNKSMDLSLSSCGGFKSVTDLNPAGSFNHLQYLELKKCDDVESVVVADRSAITAQDSFEKLERLHLHRMDKMERILHGATSSPKFFGKLKVLDVLYCSKICTILPANLLFTEKRLENLKKVKVWECDEVQHIFNTEDNEFGATPATTALLCGVANISLSSLPKLKSIWKGIMPEGSFQGLIRLSVKQCHSLQHLLPSNVAGLLQNLEEIVIEDCAAMETIICPIGEEAEETSLFPRCRLLTVDSCPKLKSIFSFCVARHLHKLTKLSISHCHGLRQVFGNGDEPRVTAHQCLLPKLTNLELADLRSLTRFDKDNLPISGPLQEIIVFVCPNLTRLPLQTVSALKFIHAEDIWFRNLEDESQALILKPYFQATPVPKFWGIDERLHSLLWKVAGLWLDDYDSQLEGTTQFRKLLFGGYLYGMPIEDVSKSGVVPCLVEFLAREDHTQLQSEAAGVLANIASKSSNHANLVIDHDALPNVVKLLCSPNELTREQAIWALETIARYSPEHQDLVLRHKVDLICQVNKNGLDLELHIFLKDFGMAGADDLLCMLSLGNAKIDLNYPPLSPIAITKERQVDQMSKEEPYIRDIRNNASVKIDDNSRQSLSTELAMASHALRTPEQDLHFIETWRNVSKKLDLNSLPSSSTELENESYVSQMPEQEGYLIGDSSNASVRDNHESDCTDWDNTSTTTTSAHDEVWNDQSIEDYGMAGADDPLCTLSLTNEKIDLNHQPPSPIEIADERQVDQMPNEEPYVRVRDIRSNPSMKIDLNNPPLSPYVRDSWSNASAEQYTFNVCSGTNNKKPLLRPKPTRKKASKIGLVKKEKHIIVRKDYGMTGADDPSSMTSLGNAKIDLKYPPSTSIEIVKYPPSSSIEIAKERHVDQMPDDELYLKDNKSNTRCLTTSYI